MGEISWPHISLRVRKRIRAWHLDNSFCRGATLLFLERNRRVSTTLSPILLLFLVPTGKLYLNVQDVLAHDETQDTSPPPTVGKQRSKPKHPKYGIPAKHWPMVIHCVIEQKEPLRTVAAYGVAHETIRRILLHTQQHGQQDV